MEEQTQIPEGEVSADGAKLSWARKRQVAYILSTVSVLLLLLAYFLFNIFYSPPTCFDGEQNQEEVGVDCGGPCDVLCAVQVRDLVVNWARAFEVSDGRYDLAASIDNPNANAGIRELRYTFLVYGKDGRLLEERSGTAFVNPRDAFVVFEPSVRLDNVPDIVEFEMKDPVWGKVAVEPPVISVKSKRLIGVETSPRLNATLLSNSVRVLFDIEAVAVVYNSAGNPIAVSSTYENEISRDIGKDIFFTWPSAFTTGPKTGCTDPADVMLVFDRSGSMGFGGSDPVQPLSDAKDAARVFVGNMQSVDRVGLVSFATLASDPIDQTLTAVHEQTQTAIDAISISEPALEQHTNIGDGIEKATDELLSMRANTRAKKAIVLLTDGVASRPLNPENARDMKYPENYAREKALAASENDFLLYVIGLGDNLNEPFLRDEVATSPSQYYNAATVADLERIYNDIAQAVCEAETFRTDVLVHIRNSTLAQ